MLSEVSCPVFRQLGCRYETVSENSTLAISVIDPQTDRYIEVNDHFCERLGYTREELLRSEVSSINPRFSRTALRDLARLLEAQRLVELHTTQTTKTGKVVNIYATVSAIRYDGRSLIHCVSLDITFLHQAKAAVAESEKRFQGTFEQAAVGIAHVATNGKWLRVNEKFCRITGYTEQELYGLTFSSITHPDDLNADWVQAASLLRGEIKTYAMEKRYIRKNGDIVWVNLTKSLARTADGSPEYFISVIEDITLRKQAEEQRDELIRTLEAQVLQRTAELERLSMTDALTGVANRRALDIALASEWARCQRSHQPVSLIAVDVDQLKTLNDHLGHAYGDECMIALAHALRSLTARPGDLFARYGGDEFLFLLPGTSAAGARKLACKARSAVHSLSLAFPGTVGAIVTLSAGVATEIPCAERTPKELLAAADRALYQAKHQGRDRVCSISEVGNVDHPTWATKFGVRTLRQ